MAIRGARLAKEPETDERRLQDYPRHERENALKVQGSALRELGHRYGIPRSSMEKMDDDKLRRQIHFAQSNSLAQAESA
jgi:hypothetical protein